MTFDDPTWWLAAAGGTLVITIGIALSAFGSHRRRIRRRAVMAPVALTEWRPTGGIDMVSSRPEVTDEDTPNLFFLLAEERREVSNIAGHAITEQRWRFASRAEAKDVVRRHMNMHEDRIPQIRKQRGVSDEKVRDNHCNIDDIPSLHSGAS